MSLTQNPTIGSRVMLPVQIQEITLDYLNHLQTIKGLIRARKSVIPFATKEELFNSDIDIQVDRPMYSIQGKITAEIEDEFETYYKIEAKNQDRVLTFYMTPGDFIVSANEGESCK